MGRRVDQRLQENEALYGGVSSERGNARPPLRSRPVAANTIGDEGDEDDD